MTGISTDNRNGAGELQHAGNHQNTAARAAARIAGATEVQGVRADSSPGAVAARSAARRNRPRQQHALSDQRDTAASSASS